MVSKDELHNSELENILAEALERLEAGEAPGTLVQSYPEAYRAELQDLLMVVDVTAQYAADSVPMPALPRRTAARRDFLSVASEFRTTQEQENASIAASAEPVATSVVENGHASTAERQYVEAETPTATRRSIFAQMGAYLQDLFVPATGRFAPIAIGALMLVLMSTASAFTVAWASIPGDLAYPLKEWARRVGLELVPEADRPAVMRAQEQARHEEVMLAQEEADRSSAIIQESLTGIFHGFRSGNGSLDLGATIVIPQYQPDANQDDLFLPMQVSGDLVPGSEVRLNYQIIPGQQGLVQGIELTVLAPPPTATPTSVPIIISTNTPTNIPQPACTVSIPNGWSGYRVQPGDSLNGVALRFGVQQGRLEQVNCLVSSGQINSGALIYVPAALPAPSVDTATPVIVPTNTATVLVVDTATPVTTLEVTATAVSTTTEPVGTDPTATPEIVVTVIASPTAEITVTAVPSTTAPPIITPTVVISGTDPDEPLTPEPVETDDTPEPDATPEPGDTSEETPTPDTVETPFEVTAESSPVVITSIPTGTVTSEVPADPEPTPEPPSESTPESDPTSDGDSGDLETPTLEAQTSVPVEGETPVPADTVDPAASPTDTPTDTSTGDTPEPPAPGEPPSEPPTASPDESGADETDEPDPDTSVPVEEPTEVPVEEPTAELLAAETQAIDTVVPTEEPLPDVATATVPPPPTDTPVPTNTPPPPPEPPTQVPASTNTPIPPTPVPPTPVPPTPVPPTNTPEPSSGSGNDTGTDDSADSSTP